VKLSAANAGPAPKAMLATNTAKNPKTIALFMSRTSLSAKFLAANSHGAKAFPTFPAIVLLFYEDIKEQSPSLFKYKHKRRENIVRMSLIIL
jgi:hypothetical protein